jgi:hypothetical protein
VRGDLIASCRCPPEHEVLAIGVEVLWNSERSTVSIFRARRWTCVDDAAHHILTLWCAKAPPLLTSRRAGVFDHGQSWPAVRIEDDAVPDVEKRLRL